MNVDVAEMGVKQNRIASGGMWMSGRWGETEDDRDRMNLDDWEVGMKQKTIEK